MNWQRLALALPLCLATALRSDGAAFAQPSCSVSLTEMGAPATDVLFLGESVGAGIGAVHDDPTPTAECALKDPQWNWRVEVTYDPGDGQTDRRDHAAVFSDATPDDPDASAQESNKTLTFTPDAEGIWTVRAFVSGSWSGEVDPACKDGCPDNCPGCTSPEAEIEFGFVALAGVKGPCKEGVCEVKFKSYGTVSFKAIIVMGDGQFDIPFGNVSNPDAAIPIEQITKDMLVKLLEKIAGSLAQQILNRLAILNLPSKFTVEQIEGWVEVDGVKIDRRNCICEKTSGWLGYGRCIETRWSDWKEEKLDDVVFQIDNKTFNGAPFVITGAQDINELVDSIKEMIRDGFGAQGTDNVAKIADKLRLTLPQSTGCELVP